MADNSRDRFSFLGREFLTWLWFETERTSGKIETATFGPVGVEFGQSLKLETGGGIKHAESLLAGEPFLVVNGDSILEVPLRDLVEFHRSRAAMATTNRPMNADTFPRRRSPAPMPAGPRSPPSSRMMRNARRRG